MFQGDVSDPIKREQLYSITSIFSQLQKAHEELNKRIFEHDKCVAEGFDRPEITLQVGYNLHVY